MTPRRSNKRLFLILGLSAVLVLGLFTFRDLLKFDLRHPFSREGWQLPNQVIQRLEIRPGDKLADIGSGDGYFTFRLADAVGPAGKVYAVDVEKRVTGQLEASVQRRGDENIVVVLGRFEDPLLPDGEIDLAFFCNSYHHIEDRITYFKRLHTDLRPQGRVAIIDLKPVPLVRLLAPADHWTSKEMIERELSEAGFRKLADWDFLPGQHFLVFAATQPT